MKETEVSMRIMDFTCRHVEEASALALAGYEEERRHVPGLPAKTDIPGIRELAENGLGVAALEGGRLVGFLCCYPPFENAFGSTKARGVFSPMGANGAVLEDRAAIYAAMYQAAAEKWVQAGAVSHALCLYAHAKELQHQFYLYGFGCRCMDGIRLLRQPAAVLFPQAAQSAKQQESRYEYKELSTEEWADLYPLVSAMYRHFQKSPFFLNRKPPQKEEFRRLFEEENHRFFGVKQNGKLCGFLETAKEGENFLAQEEGYLHVTGAYCLPECRGSGIYRRLLDYAVSTLLSEGYTHLGVDFESLNPAAYGFWKKGFDIYTHGVVRRIDEGILEKK